MAHNNDMHMRKGHKDASSNASVAEELKKNATTKKNPTLNVFETTQSTNFYCNFLSYAAFLGAKMRERFHTRKHCS